MVECVSFNTELVHCADLHKSFFAPDATNPDGDSLNSSESESVGGMNTEDLEYDEWEKVNVSCSFCKTFIDSPCKFTFKNWHVCVDRAKTGILYSFLIGFLEAQSQLLLLVSGTRLC